MIGRKPNRAARRWCETAAILALFGAAGCNRTDQYQFPPLPASAQAGELALVSSSLRAAPWTLEGTARKRVTRAWRVDLGTLAVREIRAAARSGFIHLPIVRVRATGPQSAEPVFWLHGGPGQSNLAFPRVDYFLNRHDHVMVGYRGVDGSTTLDCPEVSKAIRKHGDLLAEPATAAIRDGFAACAARLRSSGVHLDGYTPIDVVDDIEEVRRALGYEKINLLAESFGTRIAYLYALKYPERVHRSILMGANPPGRMLWESAMVETQLRRYGELWSRDPKASRRTPDLVGALRRVNGRMPRRWLFLPIHTGTVKLAAFALLFESDTAVKVFDAYVAADRGDPSGLWFMSLLSGFVFPEMTNWGDNAAKAVSADYDPARRYGDELMPPGAALGSPLARFLWAPAPHWPIRPMPEECRKLRESEVATLVLSGSLDFSTPAEHAQTDLLPLLPNGVQVILAEAGHIGDLWRLEPAPVSRLLTSFLESGRADASLMHHRPIDFQVAWGFPRLAKLALAGAAVVVVLIGAAAGRVVRIWRKPGTDGTVPKPRRVTSH